MRSITGVSIQLEGNIAGVHPEKRPDVIPGLPLGLEGLLASEQGIRYPLSRFGPGPQHNSLNSNHADDAEPSIEPQPDLDPNEPVVRFELQADSRREP